MTMHSSERFHRLPAEDRAAIDRVCVEHSAAMSSGAPAPIEARLAAATPRQRPALLIELLTIELDRRLKDRFLPTLSALQVQHPRIARAIESIYKELPTHLRLPERIGPYSVTQFVADGGQSRVVLGEAESGKPVLVKTGDGRAAAQQLGREAEILGRLQHRNIRRKIDFGIEGDTAYLALEYIAGRNLADAAEETGLAPRWAARHVLDIARAVDHIHTSGYLHRDIKPHNVIIDESGHAVLIDFALAIDENRGGFQRAPLLERGGTRAYMAPEQFLGDPEANGVLSDVYALGALLYFALTGKHPRPVYDEAPLSGERPAKSWSPSEADLAAVPQRLRQFCLASMSIDPAQRPASAADFVSALARYLRGVRLTSALKVGVPALLAVSVTGPLVWAQVGPAVTELVHGAALPWYEQLAQRSGTSFAGLDKSALKVWIDKGYVETSFMPDRSNYEVRMLPTGFPPELTSELGCECRVGGGEWETFLTFTGDDYPKDVLVHRLSPEEAASSGPIEVRFSNAFAVSREVVLGPFTYNLHVAEEIEKVIAERRGTFEKAIDCEWLRPTEQGWAFSSHLVPDHLESFQRIIVKEFGEPWRRIDVTLKDGRIFSAAQDDVFDPVSQRSASFPERHYSPEETVRILQEGIASALPTELSVELVGVGFGPHTASRSFTWDPQIPRPKREPLSGLVQHSSAVFGATPGGGGLERSNRDEQAVPIPPSSRVYGVGDFVADPVRPEGVTGGGGGGFGTPPKPAQTKEGEAGLSPPPGRGGPGKSPHSSPSNSAPGGGIF